MTGFLLLSGFNFRRSLSADVDQCFAVAGPAQPGIGAVFRLIMETDKWLVGIRVEFIELDFNSW